MNKHVLALGLFCATAFVGVFSSNCAADSNELEEGTYRVVKEPYIAKALSYGKGKKWREENILTLLRFNGITPDSDMADARNKLMLISAFLTKDAKTLKEYVDKGVSVAVRLDYGLPLYETAFKAGECLFVAALKVMLGGGANKALSLEDKRLEAYAQNAFEIMDILRNAPNKEFVQPLKGSVTDILSQAKTYKDHLQNPVVAFCPSIIGFDRASPAELVEVAAKNGGDINSSGLFKHPAIVWSIIIGDEEAVKKELELGAKVTLDDDFGNKTSIVMATATLQAVMGDKEHEERMARIIKLLKEKNPSGLDHKNVFGYTPKDYLPRKYKCLL